MLAKIRQAFDVAAKRGAFDLKESSTIFSMLAEADNKIVEMEARVKGYENMKAVENTKKEKDQD